jgi:hypothetical protein
VRHFLKALRHFATKAALGLDGFRASERRDVRPTVRGDRPKDQSALSDVTVAAWQGRTGTAVELRLFGRSVPRNADIATFLLGERVRCLNQTVKAGDPDSRGRRVKVAGA